MISPRTIRRRKANWNGHIVCRDCLLQRVIEGKTVGNIEVTGRRGRRCKQLLDDLKEARDYCKLEGKALDRTVWRTRFRRGCGRVVRQTTEGTNCFYQKVERAKPGNLLTIMCFFSLPPTPPPQYRNFVFKFLMGLDGVEPGLGTVLKIIVLTFFTC